jgi:hypothetical protein
MTGYHAKPWYIDSYWSWYQRYDLKVILALYPDLLGRDLRSHQDYMGLNIKQIVYTFRILAKNQPWSLIG